MKHVDVDTSEDLAEDRQFPLGSAFSFPDLHESPLSERVRDQDFTGVDNVPEGGRRETSHFFLFLFFVFARIYELTGGKSVLVV